MRLIQNPGSDWLTYGLVGSTRVEDAGHAVVVNVLVVALDAPAHGIVEGAVCHLFGGIVKALERALGQEVGAVLGGDGPDAGSNDGDCGDLHCKMGVQGSLKMSSCRWIGVLLINGFCRRARRGNCMRNDKRIGQAATFFGM